MNGTFWTLNVVCPFSVCMILWDVLVDLASFEGTCPVFHFLFEYIHLLLYFTINLLKLLQTAEETLQITSKVTLLTKILSYNRYKHNSWNKHWLKITLFFLDYVNMSYQFWKMTYCVKVLGHNKIMEKRITHW